MAPSKKDSKTSDPRPLNVNGPKTKKAISAMEELGLSEDVVKPVLNRLWKLFNGEWKLIEDDNYRTLADAIFEFIDEKGKAITVQDKQEPPSKRSHSSTYHASSTQKKRRQYRQLVDDDDDTDHSSSVNPSASDKKSKISDITKGQEKIKIALVNEIGIELPKFVYITQNTTFQNAHVPFSLARISDEDCCKKCSGDCLSSRVPCACSRETGGEFAYTPKGLLKDKFLDACIPNYREPQNQNLFYCQDCCPMEKAKNAHHPEPCNGHPLKKFIKECWRKCGCTMACGNRVVQRGPTCRLEVFATKGKGWAIRTLEYLPKGSFVCEYIGEILTNTELYERNEQRKKKNERHTYPVLLDNDWGSEQVLKDEEALCLDATHYGNVARFINHRCFDSNLIDIPVEVETPDHHYYHIAFFTKRNIEANEELTWDYGIDFEDKEHPIKAFRCHCESPYCRDVR